MTGSPQQLCPKLRLTSSAQKQKQTQSSRSLTQPAAEARMPQCTAGSDRSQQLNRQRACYCEASRQVSTKHCHLSRFHIKDLVRAPIIEALGE